MAQFGNYGEIRANMPPNNVKRSGSSDGSFVSGKDLITYIFPDFKAVEYFRKDFVSLNEFHILEKTESSGFEIYLVDQWIRDRKIGSVASVFTGNPQSKVKVCKLTTIKKQSRDYPPRFQEYLNELLLNHATFKKMDGSPEGESPDGDSPVPLAFLLVNNLSAMPHNLFLIPVPEGDVTAVGRRYMVNSNLKKLNCGGRSLSLLTEKVSDASEDKFRHMYCILNESVPIRFAILELVNIVQTCLFYFDLLDAKYADGLLCHKTEDAIKSWWNLIGLPHFNSKPNQKSGILSAKTVAAIISLTVSVKLRLQLIGGCDVPKDIFDAENFMISIGHFQKQVKIEKRRKLNLLTLSRLFYHTSKKHLENPNSFYVPFGTDNSLDESDPNFFEASPNVPDLASQSQSTSTYRRNKIFYSKELKKLTNVVKNTVQDHIMVKEDQDDVYMDPSLTKPSTKLRSKIASKLSDTLLPADIETFDIEVFSKKCIVGKTLLRLWVGLSVDTKFSSVDEEQVESSLDREDSVSKRNEVDGHRHQHRRHVREEKDKKHVSGNENNGYIFMSFRDSFFVNQDLHNVADKSGRLGRMKLPFQNRKIPTKADNDDSRASPTAENGSNPQSYGTLLDTELLKLSANTSPLDGDLVRSCDPSDVKANPINFRTLHRRSSFPFMNSAQEASMSTIESMHNRSTQANIPRQSTRRSASFSALENYFNEDSKLGTFEKTRSLYLEQISKVMEYEGIRKEVAKRHMNDFSVKERQTSTKVHKIYSTHTSMLQRKARFEAEYAGVLEVRMKDLDDNLDKMAFRSRDLLKKIDELDEHLTIFETKVYSDCVAKLDRMIDRVLHSTKFDYVFQDQEEKLRIVKCLTGTDHIEKAQENTWFRQVILFFYDLLLIFLRLFHFDRSKMNLDRIRSQYKVLDPDREYISKVYDFMGLELSHDDTQRSDSKSEGATKEDGPSSI